MRQAWIMALGIAATCHAEESLPQSVAGAAGTLTVSAAGLSLAPQVAGAPASEATGEHWWAVTLEPVGRDGSDVLLESQRQPAPCAKPLRDGVKLTYERLSDGTREYDVSLALALRARGGAFEAAAEIRNRTGEWVVKGFTGPVLNGIRAQLGETPALFPSGFGLRVTGAPLGEKDAKPWALGPKGYAIAGAYPSAQCTMQWMAFAGATSGLYIASHDPRQGAKTLSLRFDPVRKTCGAALQHQVYVRPGERAELPPTVFMPYSGDWHVAARTYRAWADSAGALIERPAWAQTSSGWLLAILKQQNGDVMWPYASLGQLAQVAEERGLDILGLFGWGYGGHDHLYPDYDPCPVLGGEQALRDGIKQAKARGLRVILYANGQLEERGTAYWTTTGRHLAVTRRDGGTVQEFWHKYANTTGYHFDIGCQATEGWRERMLALALQANDFGADGILYDQLGMRAPTACYAANHGHKVPFMSYEADRKEMLRQIARRMKKANPDFLIMTEGFHDAVLDSIGYFHGCVRGTFQESAGLVAKRLAGGQREELFPEMVRYTYPELTSTIRFPSPLVDRPMVNYALAFGLRYEIESRYLPDRAYLLEGRIPELADYGLVLSKPDIGEMRALPPRETAAYLRRACEFQRRHAELLMAGSFTDTEGFTLSGAGVVAKSYCSPSSFGVLLWNTGERAAPFALSAPLGAPTAAEEPERGSVDAAEALAPQTVRLVIWRKK